MLACNCHFVSQANYLRFLCDEVSITVASNSSWAHHAGNLLGLILSPLLMSAFGWRTLFLVFGIFGGPLLLLWQLMVPNDPPALTSAATPLTSSPADTADPSPPSPPQQRSTQAALLRSTPSTTQLAAVAGLQAAGSDALSAFSQHSSAANGASAAVGGRAGNLTFSGAARLGSTAFHLNNRSHSSSSSSNASGCIDTGAVSAHAVARGRAGSVSFSGGSKAGTAGFSDTTDGAFGGAGSAAEGVAAAVSAVRSASGAAAVAEVSTPPRNRSIGVRQLLSSSAVWAIIVVNVVNHW